MASADPELPCYGLGRGYNGHGLPSSSSSDPVADALEMYRMFKQSASPANYYSPPFPLLPNPLSSFNNIPPPPPPENYSRSDVAAMAMMKKMTKTKKKKQQQQQQNSLNEPNLTLLSAAEKERNLLNMATNSETATRPPAPPPPSPACKRKAAVSLVRTQRPHSFKSGGEFEDSSSVAYKRQQFCPPKQPQQNHHDNEEEEEEDEEEEEEEQDYNNEEEEEGGGGGGEEEVVEEGEGEGEGEEEEEEKKAKRNSSTIARSGKNSSKQSLNNNSAAPPKASQGYVHLRARRGQATDSHSLAERVRREKISERMKLLQDLVPGCSKTLGKAMMLDEIINYVQSLQHQVEFLSMKLAALSPQMDFQFDNLVIGEKWRSSGAMKTTENKNVEEVGNMLFNPGSNMSFQMLLNTPLTLPSHSTDFPHFKGGGGYNEDALLNAVHAAIN